MYGGVRTFGTVWGGDWIKNRARITRKLCGMWCRDYTCETARMAGELCDARSLRQKSLSLVTPNSKRVAGFLAEIALPKGAKES